MPAAYLIVESNISDPEKFKAYMAAAPAVVKAFGGRVSGARRAHGGARRRLDSRRG